MIHVLKRLAACAVLGLGLNIASAEELIVDLQGTGNQTTAEFTVKAPWILDWRINSDYNKMVSFDLDLVDGTTGVLEGNILRAKALVVPILLQFEKRQIPFPGQRIIYSLASESERAYGGRSKALYTTVRLPWRCRHLLCLVSLGLKYLGEHPVEDFKVFEFAHTDP